MTEAPFPKRKIPPKPKPAPPPEQSQKKKKKNAPDRPQPTWLFPPDEDNPVLNPKAKTPEEIAQQKVDRAKALDYIKRRVHGAPDRPAPPAQLLTLIGIFLTDFGFSSTSRLFTNERKARQELKGWEDAIGKPTETGIPKLEQVYRDWYNEWQITHADDTSSSGSGSASSDSEEEVTTKSKKTTKKSGATKIKSEDPVNSDISMDDVDGTSNKGATKEASVSSSSSSSDSDADDEEESKPKTKSKSGKKSSKSTAKPTAKVLINNLKRKAREASADSSSGSVSTKDEQPARTKKAKTNGSVRPEANPASGKKSNIFDVGSSPDASSSGSSKEDNHEGSHLANGVALPQTSNPRLSHTQAPEAQAEEDESADLSSSDGGVSPLKVTAQPSETVKDKEPKGAKPTPLAELSARASDGSYISNKYVPNAYADRAYQDLSVTRGKGFTKEKNKKKKKSYRGAIDLSGGKGFKFED